MKVQHRKCGIKINFINPDLLDEMVHENFLKKKLLYFEANRKEF